MPVIFFLDFIFQRLPGAFRFGPVSSASLLVIVFVEVKVPDCRCLVFARVLPIPGRVDRWNNGSDGRGVREIQ